MSTLAGNQITVFVLDHFEPPVEFLARHANPRRATIDAALRVGRDLSRIRPHRPEEIADYVTRYLEWKPIDLMIPTRDDTAEQARKPPDTITAPSELAIWSAGRMTAFEAPETPPLFREFGRVEWRVQAPPSGRLDRFGRWCLFPCCPDPFSPTAAALAARSNLFGFTLIRPEIPE